MQYLIFGTGDYYNRFKKWFDKQEISALLDNSEQKQHTFIDGIEVVSPEEGIKLKYDIVVILSFYVKKMREQLISLGVNEQCIYHFYDLNRLLAGCVKKRSIQYSLITKDFVCVKNSILLLSNDLTLGGPAIALLHAAKALKKHGYMVVFASMMDGPLKAMLIENGIPVIVDENLQISTMRETEWVNAFSLIVCNTMNFHVFLSERDTRVPIIWWLHDAAFFYEGVRKEVIGKISLSNLKVVSTGPVPADAVRKFLPDIVCDELLYGVADIDNSVARTEESGLTRFITIGYLEMRKGQDILLQAIKRLPGKIRCNCEFYMVGYDKTLFGERIRDESSGIKEIFLTGNVGREKIHELLSGSDVLICPSRQDPMPTVAAEAMMHSVPCIVSDAAGTAAYIHNGKDGFVFPSEEVQALAERIEWCAANKERLSSMGRMARELYEKHFSMAVFEKRFMEVVDETMEKGRR